MSVNGKQFKCSLFHNFLKERGVQHIFTALYSPQANASERVNRSILAGIRAYLRKDQTQWDKHLYDIAEALRNAYHQSIGCSPYYAVFGQQMISHGKDFELIKQLQSFEGSMFNRQDHLNILRNKLRENISIAFEKSSKRYNLRSSNKTFQVGDSVYRRNFTLSDATKKFNAKLAPKFIKATVIELKGNSLYLLEDEETRNLPWKRHTRKKNMIFKSYRRFSTFAALLQPTT